MMDPATPRKPFAALPPDTAGVLSWIHLGDLHMTRPGEQNDWDLSAIVEEINAGFAGSVSFVYLPGDVADDGSKAAYDVVRRSLDRLQIPWCAILGDHDVHEKSFVNFLRAMSAHTHYAFIAGDVRFVAMNAFDVPHPGSFAVLPEQIRWVEQQLKEASAQGQQKLLLLHCYPSELKIGREDLVGLIRRYDVRLVDMGHTHYNEVGNDGQTLYTATRSTGQIEEGPVGFSVTNIDRGVVSWRFLELGKLPAVVITYPGDERLLTDEEITGHTSEEHVLVRAKVWGKAEIVRVRAVIGSHDIAMRQILGSRIWEGDLKATELLDGVATLRVFADDADGLTAEDSIRVLVGPTNLSWQRQTRDRDNAIAAWPEHGLLGTQLGPNKNGRKW